MSTEVQLYKHVMQLFRKDFLVAMTIGPSCDRIPTGNKQSLALQGSILRGLDIRRRKEGYYGLPHTQNERVGLTGNSCFPSTYFEVLELYSSVPSKS